MKILLLSPIITAKDQLFASCVPHLGLCYIKACLHQSGFKDVKHYDVARKSFDYLVELIHKECPDVVGISCYTESRHNTFAMAKLIKSLRPECKVIIGGAHATAVGGRILNTVSNVDVLCIGEGELTMVELCKALENGSDLSKVTGIIYRKGNEVITTPPRYFIENLDEIPFPDYEGLDIYEYKMWIFSFMHGKPLAHLISARGCPYGCAYCATSLFWKKCRMRSAKNVVDELQWLQEKYGFKNFSFTDDLFTFNKKRTIDICKEIMDRKLDISWCVLTRADCVNRDVIKAMAEAGCKGIQFGVESGSNRILAELGKKETVEEYAQAFAWCKEFKIETLMNLLVGSPGENAESLHETKNLILNLKPTYLGLSSIRVFPGTPLYNRGIKEGLFDENVFLNEDIKYLPYTGSMTEPEMHKWVQKLYLFHVLHGGLKAYKAFLWRIFHEMKSPVEFTKKVIKAFFA